MTLPLSILVGFAHSGLITSWPCREILFPLDFVRLTSSPASMYLLCSFSSYLALRAAASRRRVVQRCVQLSLRLSTKLRSLPPDHSLQGFCRAATRNFRSSSSSQRVAGQETGGGGGGNNSGNDRHHYEAFSTEAGSPFSSPEDNRKWRRAGGSGSGGGNGGGFARVTRDLRLSVDVGGGIGGGGTGDDSAWRRYAEVVQEVVSAWCRDADAFDLDPLWLLPKLRAHKNW